MPQLLSEVCLELVSIKLKVLSGDVSAVQFLPSMMSFGFLSSQSALKPRILFFLPLEVFFHGLVGHVGLVFMVDTTVHSSIVRCESLKMSSHVLFLPVDPFKFAADLIEPPLK